MKAAKDNWDIILIGIVAALVAFNSLQLLSVSAALGEKTGFSIAGLGGGNTGKVTKFAVKSGGDVTQNVIAALIPKGTPPYGEDLGVSFDDPVASLNKLAALDRQIPTESLTQEQKERYVGLVTKISCEFCCGAPAVADNNGNSLCGCSHALALRGLPKYLITAEGDKWTDDEIYAEMTKWKIMFYPKNMVEKGLAAVENDLELTPAVLNDRNLMSKIKSGSTGDIGNLPTMVGGC